MKKRSSDSNNSHTAFSRLQSEDSHQSVKKFTSYFSKYFFVQVAKGEKLREVLCDHEETNSPKCCFLCFERRYQPTKDLLRSFSVAIDKLILKETQMKSKNPSPLFSDMFSSEAIPEVATAMFLFRCVRYLDKWFEEPPGADSFGVNILLMSFMNYENLSKVHTKEIVLSPLNFHRVFGTLLLFTAKAMHDTPISNLYWSKVIGIDLETLNKLELEICTKFDVDVNIDEDAINNIRAEFE
eukprot:snap_masked-scaffold_5-processed-gene-5.43-mRNA-1 protein AED:1.00 eAED:1.00 QI:0/-1/0/0/-1/1/1/0/239